MARLHEFCQLLSLFDHDRVPLTLFSRACTDLSTWSPNGERGCRSPEDAMVPAYLKAFFKPGDHLSEGIRVAIKSGVISLEKHGPVQFLKLDRVYREELRAEIPTSVRVRLFFDILSVVIHAFPECYAELLWTEMEALLREAVESTYLTLLAVIKTADILQYLSSKPSNIQSRYLERLLLFLLRMPNWVTPKAPRWISSLIADVMQLIMISNPAFSQETSHLNLLVSINQILELSRLNLGSKSDTLEQLRRLDHQGEERSNAAVGLALISLLPKLEAMQSTESFEDLAYSWKPLSESHPSTLEIIVLAKLSGIAGHPTTLSLTWQGLDIEVKVILAFEMVRSRNLQEAQTILEESLEEVEQKYGPKSPEIFTTTAELLHCHNALAVRDGERNICPMVLSRLSDLSWPGVLGCQFLLIQYVDHLIGLGKYLEAEKWMQIVLEDSSAAPSTAAMVALRMLKARRRQTKAWLDDGTPSCMRVLVKSFLELSDSLKFEAIEEVLVNIYLVDMRDPEQTRQADEIITDLRGRMAELPRAWTSCYPVLESHMQSLDRYSRAFSRRIGLYKIAENKIVGDDTAQVISAPLQTGTTAVSVEAPNASWEDLVCTTSRKLEWIISWPLGFGKQISALGWAGIGLVDMNWVTSTWQEMAVKLLIGNKPASCLMKRAIVDKRGSIILQPMPTERAGKGELEPTTLNAEYSGSMPASAALTLGTSKPEMLQSENAHQLRKWQFADRRESDLMPVKFGRRARAGEGHSTDAKDIYATCAFRLLYGKITFALRRVRL